MVAECAAAAELFNLLFMVAWSGCSPWFCPAFSCMCVGCRFAALYVCVFADRVVGGLHLCSFLLVVFMLLPGSFGSAGALPFCALPSFVFVCFFVAGALPFRCGCCCCCLYIGAFVNRSFR
ncbi:hypothetical protein U1Q18_013436 [Sarracenia purpurea var. burkii]